MHRFRIKRSDIHENSIVLSDDENRHLNRVLRLQVGDEIELTDGERNYLARIDVTRRDSTSCVILKEIASREPESALTLYMGVVKGEKMDWIVQKCCELGVKSIVPVMMERSVRVEGENRRERRQRIADEASKQCGRAGAVYVSETLSFAEALDKSAAHQQIYLAYECGGEPLRKLMPCTDTPTDVALWIGPEGGVSPEEALALQTIGAKTVTLGPRILRAETAAIVAVSAVMLLLGEIDTYVRE